MADLANDQSFSWGKLPVRNRQQARSRPSLHHTQQTGYQTAREPLENAHDGYGGRNRKLH